MHVLPISKIVIPPERQRQEFNPEAGVELAASIARIGLINPLTVDLNGDGQAILRAGERRLRAIKSLELLGKSYRCAGIEVKPGFAACLYTGELTRSEQFEIELEENIQRLDLTWQEKARALQQLHTLRQMQNPAHTITETVQELRERGKTAIKTDIGLRADVQRDLMIAKHLDDPDVARAKDAGEASKIILRKEDDRRRELHAAVVGKTFSASDHTLLMGDCLEILPSIPEASFDVILTDPPYGMGADGFGDGAGKMAGITHQYSDDEEHVRALLGRVAPEITRVAKAAAHLYVCCDIDQFAWLRELFTGLGWRVFRTPLINYKRGSGRVPLPEHGPRRQWEPILYAYRGEKKCTAIYSDVIESQADENLGHGAQKPVNLFENLLRRSVRDGDSILDPFAGTGTIFEAAHGLQCRATGIELEAKYFGLAAQRIEGLK